MVHAASTLDISEAWGPPQFQGKRSRSEKAILGALGEFRGFLGAALGIRNSILGIRNSILGMASHDLSNTKTIILGATPGAIPGIDGNPHERFSCAPAFSERFFKNWGGPRAPKHFPSDTDCFGSVERAISGLQRTNGEFGLQNPKLSGPNRAMQPRCAMRFESHTSRSLAMRKRFSPATQNPPFVCL